MEKMGGVFVLRGIPGNSFAMFTQKLAELRKKGITASILIDPESFEEYGISSVPTIVLVEEGKYDKMTGNVPVQTALVAFKEKRSNQRI
jgi:conjugal transfer pilus assembly protein TrbC